MQSNLEDKTKLPYEVPTLTKHGDMKALTISAAGSACAPGPDGDCPPDDIFG